MIGVSMIADTFNPSSQEAKAARSFCEFEGSLVYTVNSRTARATQREPVSKHQNIKKGIKPSWVSFFNKN